MDADKHLKLLIQKVVFTITFVGIISEAKTGLGKREMNKTGIEYVDFTWNPITGCTKCSPGCDHCYAERMAKRFAGRFGYPKDNPFAPGTFHADKLDEPLKLKKPSKIFVCSMGDLFHNSVDFEVFLKVMEVIAECAQLTFLFLTKRPKNMKFRLTSFDIRKFPNVWLGVTVCNQEEADAKIPVLFTIPAVKRFVSIEPILGPVSLQEYVGNGGLDWVISGSETGTKARPAELDWFSSLRKQCRVSGTPFFLKQITAKGNDHLCGTQSKEFPE